MNIVFSKDGVYTTDNKDLNASTGELEVFEHVKKLLPDEDITLERRSDNYVSVIIAGNDFMRIKWTDKAKWVSILMTNECKDKWEDSPLFAAQKKKTQIFWKSALEEPQQIAELAEPITSAAQTVKSYK